MMNIDFSLTQLLAHWATQPCDAIESINKGLINATWLLLDKQVPKYVLQQLNTAVFKAPAAIEKNILAVAQHLAVHHPDYAFVAPIKSKRGSLHVQYDGQYFRLFPFVANSTSFDTVVDAEQAFAAAQAFGQLSKLLSALPIASLDITIPDFHNLPLRFKQFRTAMQNAQPERLALAETLIDNLLAQQVLIEKFEWLAADPTVRQRIFHHDTKISNLLFDVQNNGKVLAVIDLDTLMPGYFWSDLGDMFRTYLCGENEDSIAFEKISIRKPMYAAIVDGYCQAMGSELSEMEKNNLDFAGQMMMYMQALRFLTDFLNNDAYYGAAYPLHNLNRAKNQMVLLQQFNQFILAK
jgi:aminoglycoside phosphotransferase (APT) family kinase protein